MNLLNIDWLMWLLPSGWLAAIASWWVHRHRTRAEDRRASSDALLDMSRTLKDELRNLQNENLRLYAAIRELNSTIAQIGRCPHVDSCPVIDRLPVHAASADPGITELFHKRPYFDRDEDEQNPHRGQSFKE